MRDFFFRVAALTFESSVLAELERSSARKIGDTVREYPELSPHGCPPFIPHPPSLCPSRDQQQRERPVPVSAPQETQVLPVRWQPPAPPGAHTSGPKRGGLGWPPGAIPATPGPPSARAPTAAWAGAPVWLPQLCKPRHCSPGQMLSGSHLS